MTGRSSTWVKPQRPHVVDEQRGDLAVAEQLVGVVRSAPPGAEVDLVDRDRAIGALALRRRAAIQSSSPQS